VDYPAASQFHKFDLLSFAGLEAHCSSCGDVQAHTVCRRAIEFEKSVGFKKMKMAPNLNRPIPRVLYHQLCGSTSLVGRNRASGFIQPIFSWLHSFGLPL
jgi:hypothetical protein